MRPGGGSGRVMSWGGVGRFEAHQGMFGSGLLGDFLRGGRFLCVGDGG